MSHLSIYLSMLGSVLAACEAIEAAGLCMILAVIILTLA